MAFEMAPDRTLDALLRSSTVAVVAVDREMLVRLWNPGAVRMYGWTASEVRGEPLPVLPPDRAEAMRELRARVLAGEEFDELEIEQVRKDGNRTRNKLSLRPLRSPDGEVVGVLGVASEVDPEEEVRALADRLQHLELELAESRIQPHFLFNSLHLVSCLLQAGQPDRALRTVEHLADLLRHVVDADRRERVPLEDEVRFCRDYLALEEARGEEELRLAVDAPDEALSARVPALLLQPLVENAVRHGLRGREGGGTVRIVAARTPEALGVTVRDDGSGLPTGWSGRPHFGTGLRTIDARLRLQYGDRYGFLVENRPDGKGTEVRIRVPADEG